MKFLLAVVAMLAVAGLIGWYELSLWGECRATHSWMYCWRILS